MGRDVGALCSGPIGDWYFNGHRWIASARAGRLTPSKLGRRGGSRLDAQEGDPPASSLPSCREPARQTAAAPPLLKNLCTGRADLTYGQGGERSKIPSRMVRTLLSDCQLLLVVHRLRRTSSDCNSMGRYSLDISICLSLYLSLSAYANCLGDWMARLLVHT